MGKRTKTKLFCIDCKKKISPYSRKTTKRCSDCRYKSENMPTYKDGRCLKKYYCPCGKEIDWQTSLYKSGLCGSCSHKEENNPNFKNGLGITPLVHNVRNCLRYRLWRSDVFTVDDFTCQICNKRGGDLNVHHSPKSFSEIMSEYKIKTLEDALNCAELWNINNGITLCTYCHKLVHKIKSKKRREG